VKAIHRIDSARVKSSSSLAIGCRIAVGVALSAWASWSCAAGYKIVRLETLGGSEATALAINNAGTVVGSSGLVVDSVEYDRATMWKDGTVIDLGSVEGTDSHVFAINGREELAGSSRIKPALLDEKAVKWRGGSPKVLKSLAGPAGQGRGINPDGVIVGWSRQKSVDHAARWDDSGVHDLGTLGGDSSYALAINRAGIAVGYSEVAAEFVTEHAVRWDVGGQPVDLGTLGGKNSVAFGINDGGTIVGMSDLPEKNIFHAVRWNGLVAVDLGALGGASQRSMAYDINKAGVVVGRSQDASANWRATVWSASGLVDLNDHLDAAAKAEGWVLEFARAINASGQVVCNGRNTQTAVFGAFLATPVAD
jgi:probable HAF family extracellular repeat protein